MSHAELDSASTLLISLSWNKETKFKAVSNHAKNIRLSSRRFELAALKQQIVSTPANAFDAPLFFTHDLIRPFWFFSGVCVKDWSGNPFWGTKKDWNGKPGEPFGENALIFFYTPIFLCLETKKQNSRLYQIMLKIKGCQADALNSLRSNSKSSPHLPTHLMHLYFSRIIW